MVAKDVDKQLELIRLGAVEIINEKELRKKLEQGKPLIVKAGFDPTAPDIHFGHTLLLHKLRHFQELGHTIVFLIGDFTARIGDPSGESKTRPPLSKKKITENAKTYKKQAFKILDKKKTKVVFNSSWFDKLNAEDIIRLASQYTVARMLERDDFHKRYKNQKPISIHEFLYPLLQGYDSVELKADVELGGTDQKFNLLVGRALQKDSGQNPQVIITMPLIEGTDGVNKMSKSLGNYIGVNEPPKEILGKVMSISDKLMDLYIGYSATASVTVSLEADWAIIKSDDVEKHKQKIRAGGNPRDDKMRLAKFLVKEFHDEASADAAEAAFDAQFRRKEMPQEMENFPYEWKKPTEFLSSILSNCGAVKSSSEARRLIKQGAISVDGEKIGDQQFALKSGEYKIRIGKKRYVKIEGR